MDEQAKKTALLMIPYGLYVLSAKHGDHLATGTVNWVTQASFQPPLVAMGVKRESGLFEAIKGSGRFALSVLGTGQKDIAFAFFKSVEPEGDTLAGYRFETHTTGAPILVDAPAWVEARTTDIVERGDHAVVIGEVIEAGIRSETGVLTLAECGVKYGG